jgi:hypothetical protein
MPCKPFPKGEDALCLENSASAVDSSRVVLASPCSPYHLERLVVQPAKSRRRANSREKERKIRSVRKIDFPKGRDSKVCKDWEII